MTLLSFWVVQKQPRLLIFCYKTEQAAEGNAFDIPPVLA